VASRCPHCPPAARQWPSKIASIGVRVDVRGVSRHGFALNLHPDMSYWEGIIACDLPNHPQISVADLLEPVPTLEQACDAVIQAFGRVFSFRMLEVPQAQQLLA
jgi:lipoate-protein ligase B